MKELIDMVVVHKDVIRTNMFLIWSFNTCPRCSEVMKVVGKCEENEQ
jgi:hypothetical protein